MNFNFIKSIWKKAPLLVLLILFSCNSNDTSSLNLDEKYKFNNEEYAVEFKNFLQNTDSSFLKLLSNAKYYDTIKTFYSSREFKPLWTETLDNKSIIENILSYLENSYKHGINSKLYDVDLIKELFGRVFTSDSVINSSNYKNLASLELLISNSLVNYSQNLKYGVVDPNKIHPEKYSIPLRDSLNKEILSPLLSENILEYLKNIQPKSSRYLKLQSALLGLFEKSLNGKLDKIPVITGKIKLKDKSTIIIPVSGRLKFLGFLDSSYVYSETNNTYDSVLFKAVAKFQKSCGLNEDGVLGKETIEKLNISLEERIEKAKLSLERFRWTSYGDSSRYILVNIPDFNVYGIENDDVKFKIRVCTGKKHTANYEERLKNFHKTGKWISKPDDWETPQVYGRITHLILNPTWTVPPSIIREEIYSESMKDSNYLRKKNFKIFRNGKQVDVSEVDLRKYHRDHVPYSFVQNAGPGNALGRIKFMFQNIYGVYLHDTPTRPPFGYNNRAVSHGCVRVEKPFILAEFLLRNHSRWNLDYIRIETGYTVDDKTKVAEYRQIRSELIKGSSYGKTTEVKLDLVTPLFIDYYTAWVDEDGIFNFRDDVYGKDKILKKFILL